MTIYMYLYGNHFITDVANQTYPDPGRTDKMTGVTSVGMGLDGQATSS